MTRSLRLAVLSLTLLAGSLSRPVHAADGRIPISSAPFTISAPGSYYVTQDLSLAAGNMITISAGDVNLDLMNHTLNHSGTISGDNGILVSGSFSNIRITGGRINGGYMAVNLGGGPPNAFYQIDHLLITGQAFAGIITIPSAQIRMLIEDNNITAVNGIGMQLNWLENSRIERNVVSRGINGSNFAIGIYLFGSNYNRISDNVVTVSMSDGIRIAGASSNNTLDWNTAVGNGGYGLNIQGGTNNIYSSNRLSGNTTGNAFTGGVSAGGNNAGAGNF